MNIYFITSKATSTYYSRTGSLCYKPWKIQKKIEYVCGSLTPEVMKFMGRLTHETRSQEPLVDACQNVGTRGSLGLVGASNSLRKEVRCGVQKCSLDLAEARRGPCSRMGDGCGQNWTQEGTLGVPKDR